MTKEESAAVAVLRAELRFQTHTLKELGVRVKARFPYLAEMSLEQKQAMYPLVTFIE